jgi:hypothetical protein
LDGNIMTEKPWPGFPLFRHRNGQWAKKIKGHMYYFGTEAEAAYQRYARERADLEAGRVVPLVQPRTLQVGELVNRCLDAKMVKVQSGEIKQRTFDSYRHTARYIVKVLGRNRLVNDLQPTDFAALRAELVRHNKSLPMPMLRPLSTTAGCAEWQTTYGSGCLHPMAYCYPPASSSRRRHCSRDGDARLEARKVFRLDPVARLARTHIEGAQLARPDPGQNPSLPRPWAPRKASSHS